jgi:hypothetical protein
MSIISRMQNKKMNQEKGMLYFDFTGKSEEKILIKKINLSTDS